MMRPKNVLRPSEAATSLKADGEHGPAKVSGPVTGSGLPAELVIHTNSCCTSGESLPLRILGTHGTRFPVHTKMPRYDFESAIRHLPPPLARAWGSC